MDHICKLYELNKNSGSDYLIKLYEDRLRKHLHDRCARGEVIIMETECGKTNVNVMDACKTRLQAVLQAAGLQDTSAHRQNYDSSDPAASAAAKQQAMWNAENKKLQLQSNAMKIREESYAKKVQSLQQSQPNYSAGKFTKSWNSSNKSRGKGKGKVELKPYRSTNPGWQPPAKGKQKNKGKQNANRYKNQSQW